MCLYGLELSFFFDVDPVSLTLISSKGHCCLFWCGCLVCCKHWKNPGRAGGRVGQRSASHSELPFRFEWPGDSFCPCWQYTEY